MSNTTEKTRGEKMAENRQRDLTLPVDEIPPAELPEMLARIKRRTDDAHEAAVIALRTYRECREHHETMEARQVALGAAFMAKITGDGSGEALPEITDPDEEREAPGTVTELADPDE